MKLLLNIFSKRETAAPMLALAFASAVSVAFIVARIACTGNFRYAFLAWNLFLAWLPLGFAAAMVRLRRGRRTRAAAIPAGLLWLAFFPNAPYIVTDYVHIGFEGTRHLALDLTMLTAAAAAGMVLALGSLRLVHDAVRRRLGDVAGFTFVCAVATASAIGVYLGRVLRWNSWQLFSHPDEVGRDVWARIADPQAHGRAVGGTVAFALAFAAAYLVAGAAPAHGASIRPAQALRASASLPRAAHGPKSEPDA
jgi:uncharacterized membrane protein